MGKRELLLIALFAVVGAIVYRVTVPAGESDNGFSLGKLIQHIRSEMRGQNVQLQVTRTALADAEGVSTLRLDLGELRGVVRIVGEERSDVAAELQATVFGMDQAQAEQFQKAISLALEPEPEEDELAVRLGVRTNEMRRGPRVQLTIKAPARLVAKVSYTGELEAAGLSGISFERGAGKAMLSSIAGPVSGEFEGGTIEVEGAAGINLEARHAEVRLARITGEIKLEAEGGDVRIRAVNGPVELSLRRVDAEIEDVNGPVKLDGEGGHVRVRNPGGPVTIETERMEVGLTLSTAVPVEVSTTGETLEVMLPPQGLRLHATANNGQIRASDTAIVVTDEEEQRRVASATLRGGGPLIKLETTRGDIIIR